MYVPLKELSPANTYFLMTQTIIPRPIAWVLTENETGTYNLAPFSYFNAVSSDPAVFMLSVGKKPDGSDKDTHRNIVERKYFTLHIADPSLLDALNQSSATLEKNQSEVDELDLTLCDFEGASLPRIVACKVAFACELFEIHSLAESSQTIIYGKINALYIDDSIVDVNEKGRLKVHADKLQPISRLGANEYMCAGKVVQKPRPA